MREHFQTKSGLTKRAPDAGDSAHIPSSFTRLSLFLAGRLRRPRPSAGNANRWAAKSKFFSDSQVSFHGLAQKFKFNFLAVAFLQVLGFSFGYVFSSAKVQVHLCRSPKSAYLFSPADLFKFGFDLQSCFLLAVFVVGFVCSQNWRVFFSQSFG